MKKGFLFISCDEAKHICDKRQYGEASGWEYFKLMLRLSYCRITRAYSNNNKKLTEAMKKSELDCLKNDERHQLQQQFDEELAKRQ